jgi:hypothetical protein
LSGFVFLGLCVTLGPQISYDLEELIQMGKCLDGELLMLDEITIG